MCWILTIYYFRVSILGANICFGGLLSHLHLTFWPKFACASFSQCALLVDPFWCKKTISWIWRLLSPCFIRSVSPIPMIHFRLYSFSLSLLCHAAWIISKSSLSEKWLLNLVWKLSPCFFGLGGPQSALCEMTFRRLDGHVLCSANYKWEALFIVKNKALNLGILCKGPKGLVHTDKLWGIQQS